jgi:hypothetical protein
LDLASVSDPSRVLLLEVASDFRFAGPRPRRQGAAVRRVPSVSVDMTMGEPAQNWKWPLSL